MWKNTQKIILSLSLIVMFALYALQRQALPQSGEIAAVVRPAAAIVVQVPTSNVEATVVRLAPTVASRTKTPATHAKKGFATKTPSPLATATVAPPTATANSAYRDGTYQGTRADANWGIVQVQVAVTNGQISDVQFLEFPNHRSYSKEINSEAMPILTQEAIQSQKAHVDIVSGATDTSEAFVQSLASALRQAAS